ncbi:MAG: cobalamin B12-binding domain-containing protein [Deferribacteres bacterium]|nr:cobalamin-dependent protein [candidate division KSB1 bacterium]MCB9501017.1 cobalamin B12-binding domain-containing protein [Deferribacteres bacterium]
MPTISEINARFLHYIQSLDQQGADKLISNCLKAGLPPEQIITKIIMPAIDAIAEKQKNREVVVAQIYVMAKIAENEINKVLVEMPIKPRTKGTVIIGTPMGDYHGLGKKLVATFLRLADYQVMDLGLSVNHFDFVNMAIAFNAKIICVSALLLHTALGITEIRKELDSRGYNHIKIVVGGALFNFNPKLSNKYGADAMAPNALDAVRVVRELAGDF